MNAAAETDFIKLPATSSTLATFWRPYTLARDPAGFVYLDRALIEAKPELVRLLGEAVKAATTGRRAFHRDEAPPQPPPPAKALGLDVVELRDKTCRACDGQTLDAAGKRICADVEAKHPGRALIEAGVQRVDAKCPRGKWD